MQQIEQQFRWTVRALARSAEVQRSLLPSLVVVADELALDFDNWRRTLEAHFGDSWSQEQRRSVQALECLLGEMIGDKPEIWSASGCLYHPTWTEVRRLAVDVLNAFGWPQGVPPLHHSNMTDEVTHIWFRTTLPLNELARRLGLEGCDVDCENYWEWVIGTLGDVQLDITRTHTRTRWQVDTTIFLVGDEGWRRPFSEPLIADLVSRLRTIVTGAIFCGRWEYLSGNDFNIVGVQKFKPTGRHSR